MEPKERKSNTVGEANKFFGIRCEGILKSKFTPMAFRIYLGCDDSCFNPSRLTIAEDDTMYHFVSSYMDGHDMYNRKKDCFGLTMLYIY
jgi:hypothetical protein